MQKINFSLPTMALISIANVVLGFGVGWHVADWITVEQRQAGSPILIVIGTSGLIPLALAYVTTLVTHVEPRHTRSGQRK